MFARIAVFAALVGHLRARYILVACGVFIGLVLAIGTVLLGVELRQQDLHHAKQDMMNLSLVLSEETDRGLQAVELVQLGLMDHLRELGIDSPEKLRRDAGSFEIHQDLMHRISGLSHIGSLALVDRDGMRLNITRVWPSPPVDDSDRDFIRTHLASPTSGLFISEPSLSKSSGEWTIYLSRPFIASDGQLIGIVVATIQARYFEAFFSRIGPENDGTFALYRRDGMLLARYPHVDPKIGTTYAGTVNFNRLLGSLDRDAIVQNSLIDGRERLIAAHGLTHYPLIFAVTSSMDAVLADWYAQVGIFGVVATVLELAIGGIALLGFRALRGAERSDAARASAESELTLSRERERGELALRKQFTRFEMALSNMRQALLMIDDAGNVLLVNRRFREMSGLPMDAVTPGMSYVDLMKLAVTQGNIRADDLRAIRRWREEVIGRHAHMAFIWELLDGRAFNVTHQPMAEGWLTTYEDITERRAAEATIAHLAGHDALTDLPNRALFHDKLEQALAAARRGQMVALHCLDLDHFKTINDTLGHPIGDRLLQVVAERLRAALRASDTVARLGGDEFAIVQTEIASPIDATGTADRLIEVISSPFEIDGHEIVIGTSIGIAFAPQDGLDADQLMKCADLALYRAKSAGRGAYQLFQVEMDLAAQARRVLELDLRRALPARQLELFYQPMIDLRTMRIAGFEALLRWRHPTKGLIPPDQFIPLAEETGLIVPIGEWVLRQACADAAIWPDGLKVAVNLSAVQFKSHNLVPATINALCDAGMPANRLELEITETVMLHDTDTTLATLHRFRDLGIRIAMDDFGTGYSSLGYLVRFPFDRIKIDQRFVRELSKRADCITIVRAVAALGHELGMATTAEGVETRQQLDVLSHAGCTEVQGYLFSRPVPGAAVANLLRSLPTIAGPLHFTPPVVSSRRAEENEMLSSV